MTRNVKVKDTSLAAYRTLNPDSVKAIEDLIEKALMVLGLASTEQIAEYTGKPHAKIHKRVAKMEREERIWRPGAKTLTKSNRSAYLWQIRGDNQPKTDKEENAFKKGQTSATDHASKILSHNQPLSQTNLFQ